MGIVNAVTQYGVFTTIILALVVWTAPFTYKSYKVKAKHLYNKLFTPKYAMHVRQSMFGRVLNIMWVVSVYWLVTIYFF